MRDTPCCGMKTAASYPSIFTEFNLGLIRIEHSNMPRLADELKWRIIFEWKRSNNYSKVARACGVSREAARRWIQRFETTGCVQQPIRSKGRNPALSTDAANIALNMFKNGNITSAEHVARMLHEQGHTSTKAHRTTVTRHAKKAAKAEGTNLWLIRGKPQRVIGDRTKQKRLSFATANRSRAWCAVMFSDRQKFLLQYPGSRISMQRWSVGKTKAAAAIKVMQPNHPKTVNIYAGITRHRVPDVHVVAGTYGYTSSHHNKTGVKAKNITSSEYQEVLTKTLLPEGGKIFSNVGVSTWYLQQDNDPSHKVAAAVIKAYNEANSCSVQLLPNWPPSSPDLNLIESVWAWVQARVNEKGCSTFEEFKAEVRAQFMAVPKSMLANLFKSMPKRIKNVIELGGEKTKY